MPQLSEVKKSVISVLTLIVASGTPLLNEAGVLHLPSNDVLIFSGIIAVAGSVLHYLVPNTTTDPAVASSQSVTLVAPSSV